MVFKSLSVHAASSISVVFEVDAADGEGSGRIYCENTSSITVLCHALSGERYTT